MRFPRCSVVPWWWGRLCTAAFNMFNVCAVVGVLYVGIQIVQNNPCHFGPFGHPSSQRRNAVGEDRDVRIQIRPPAGGDESRVGILVGRVPAECLLD